MPLSPKFFDIFAQKLPQAQGDVAARRTHWSMLKSMETPVMRFRVSTGERVYGYIGCGGLGFRGLGVGGFRIWGI